MSGQPVEASERPKVLLAGDPAARPEGLEPALTRAGFHILSGDMVGSSAAPDAVLITLSDIHDLSPADLGSMRAGASERPPHVVLLSARDPERPAEALRLGAADALAAPVHLPELSARLHARIREHRARLLRTTPLPPETTASGPTLEILERRVKEEFERARRYSLSFSLVLLGIDELRGLEDRLGRETAARLREVVSDRLRGELRLPDLVVPFTADEFAIVLPETGESGARQSVVRLRERLTSVPLESDPRLEATRFSAGIVTYPHPAALQTGDLFAMAEAALMRGRAQVGERIGVAM